MNVDSDNILPSAADTMEPETINVEEQDTVQENDSEMQVQYSEDMFETDDTNNASENPDPDVETVPNKVKEKVERSTQLPLSRIKHIMKLDPDVALVNQDASFLITKATELFINFLSKESCAFTLSKKKKTVTRQDVNSAINSDSPLFFLQGCLED